MDSVNEVENSRRGHRERLRKRFLATDGRLSDRELLELLLTYAIPRKNVRPQVKALISRFGGLREVLAASVEDLSGVDGIGGSSAILIGLVGKMVRGDLKDSGQWQAPPEQGSLFEMEPSLGPLFEEEERKKQEMRTYANDEIANALRFIPQAHEFDRFEDFKLHLKENLPYNSISTRERRTYHILQRFLPSERLDVPLVYYATRCEQEEDLKPVLFYHALTAEPLAARVAEGLVWPALPVGHVERDEMREFLQREMPDLREASQAKALRALHRTYVLLSVGIEDGTTLRFRVHHGSLPAFLYVLTCEFPGPGMYSFEAIDRSPMRRWLLWDSEWMRLQLYNLRDLGIISKVSEIDEFRQFTLKYPQMQSLELYFEKASHGLGALREVPPS